MNSFDLLKFRNQLLAENKLIKENTLNKDFYILDTEGMEPPMGPFNIMQASAKLLELGDGFTIIDQITKDEIYPGDSSDEGISEGDQYIDPVELEQLAYRHAEEAVNNIPQYIFDQDYFMLYAKKFAQNFINFAEMNKKDLNNLDEGTLEEMASFYKLTDDSPEAKAAIAAAKEKYKPGTTLYNTLDTLEKVGEIDYKELAKATGKDMATFNNPKSRGVLEKDLAAFVQAGSSPSAVRTGRPADPNKVAAAPKEKTAKLKITNPKPSSTKLADLAPADVFSGAAPDEEEMEMEKQAQKAAKGNKRLGTAVEKLAQVTKEMKALAKEYQAAKGTPEEAGIVAQLKDLTAEKKALEKKTAPRQMSAADLMGGEDL